MNAIIASSIVTVFVLAGTALHAQWTNLPSANVPRTTDGKPNLSAPAPRLPDGKPDLSGIWRPENTYQGAPQNFAANLKVDNIPYQPWAKALLEERQTGVHEREDSSALCLPQGLPRVNAAPGQWKVIQNPDFIVIIYEAFSILWRQIFLDGREMAADAPPTWLGYSTGKWDGDTLVVDSKGFNGKFWIDQQGKPVTEALHVIERFHRKDFGHMDVEITIDDPKAYTRPWTFMEHVRLLTDTELMEAICNENNIDLEHIPVYGKQ
ncbi:MAG: hypothetical protein DMG15_22815 [Acidobacteria bacterium]|nr:MAG: hypothetical protein DMG15_22815 [Acidobacteriota bacterium]